MLSRDSGPGHGDRGAPKSTQSQQYLHTPIKTENVRSNPSGAHGIVECWGYELVEWSKQTATVFV